VKLLPITPTRVLRLNLPPDQGGIAPAGNDVRLTRELQSLAPAQEAIFLWKLPESPGPLARNTWTT